MLTSGDPRSLGRTQEVVELVIADQTLLEELYSCLFQDDEIIRMRAGDALEKVCRQNPEWFDSYKERLLSEVPKIRQPSVQWHLAQMLSEIQLTAPETKSAIKIMKRNLETMDDWTVTNLTLEALATFVRRGSFGTDEFIVILKQQLLSRHKSVVARSNKLLREFENA